MFNELTLRDSNKYLFTLLKLTQMLNDHWKDLESLQRNTDKFQLAVIEVIDIIDRGLI